MDTRSTRKISVWLILTLAIAAFYSGLAMQEAFSDPTVIQDDARVYLLWMQRFLDPSLFLNDPMARYFHSVTPWGLETLYWLASRVGISPILFSKILPAILTLLVGWYGYRLTLALFPVPIAGFFSSVILLQSCWQRDDLASGSPRSFWAVLLAAFLYYLVKRSWIAIALVVILMALFCPLAAILIVIWFGLRGLWGLKTRSVQRAEWMILTVTIAMLLPYVFSQSEFAPTVNAAQARLMPEFQAGGRLPFFFENPWRFWFEGTDSGFQVSFNPVAIGLGLLLPGLAKFRKPELLKPDWIILPQIAGAGIVGFFLAHALFVKLHFPSRYITHSWRIAMAVAAGIVIAIAFEKLRSQRWLCAILATAIVLFPHVAWKDFPHTGYGGGRNPELYAFIKALPKTTFTAYLGEDANNLPLLSQRSTLVAQEYAVPFHLGYYLPMRQKAVDLINAQYSESLEPAKKLIRQYQVTHWLIDANAFTLSYFESYRWLRLFQDEKKKAIALLTSGRFPALYRVLPNCAVTTISGTTVVDAVCVLAQK
ncbi:MAG: hypothetical protein MUC48_00525 [Leptolyngbya sp. Prado105]|jgi:hypothetical protein|nr:hypothetical protein [Leptolyngbya sp. Prado105]